MSEYAPRPHFEGFRNRAQRRSVIIAHRRAGKTVACVRDLLTRALATKKTNARFAYLAPFYSQAKATAWDYLKLYARDVATKVSEMSGGVGSILGTFLGTFNMAEVRTGLVLLGTDAYVQEAFVGLVIALAVIVNVRLSARRK